MRKLVLFPLMALALACTDATMVEPDLAPHQQLTSAQAPSFQGMEFKAVPFKGDGTWSVVGADFGQCEGEPGLITYFMQADVRSTHLGRSGIDFSACWTPAGTFVSTQGTITAANGDELYYLGSAAEHGTTHPFYPDGTWEIGPVHITGGSGRFVGAVGLYHGHGTMEESAGIIAWEGWISSVGSKE